MPDPFAEFGGTAVAEDPFAEFGGSMATETKSPGAQRSELLRYMPWLWERDPNRAKQVAKEAYGLEDVDFAPSRELTPREQRIEAMAKKYGEPIRRIMNPGIFGTTNVPKLRVKRTGTDWEDLDPGTLWPSEVAQDIREFAEDEGVRGVGIIGGALSGTAMGGPVGGVVGAGFGGTLAAESLIPPWMTPQEREDWRLRGLVEGAASEVGARAIGGVKMQGGLTTPTPTSPLAGRTIREGAAAPSPVRQPTVDTLAEGGVKAQRSPWEPATPEGYQALGKKLEELKPAKPPDVAEIPGAKPQQLQTEPPLREGPSIYESPEYAEMIRGTLQTETRIPPARGTGGLQLPKERVGAEAVAPEAIDLGLMGRLQGEAPVPPARGMGPTWESIRKQGPGQQASDAALLKKLQETGPIAQVQKAETGTIGIPGRSRIAEPTWNPMKAGSDPGVGRETLQRLWDEMQPGEQVVVYSRTIGGSKTLPATAERSQFGEVTRWTLEKGTPEKRIARQQWLDDRYLSQQAAGGPGKLERARPVTDRERTGQFDKPFWKHEAGDWQHKTAGLQETVPAEIGHPIYLKNNEVVGVEFRGKLYRGTMAPAEAFKGVEAGRVATENIGPPKEFPQQPSYRLNPEELRGATVEGGVKASDKLVSDEMRRLYMDAMAELESRPVHDPFRKHEPAAASRQLLEKEQAEQSYRTGETLRSQRERTEAQVGPLREKLGQPMAKRPRKPTGPEGYRKPPEPRPTTRELERAENLRWREAEQSRALDIRGQAGERPAIAKRLESRAAQVDPFAPQAPIPSGPVASGFRPTIGSRLYDRLRGWEDFLSRGAESIREPSMLDRFVPGMRLGRKLGSAPLNAMSGAMWRFARAVLRGKQGEHLIGRILQSESLPQSVRVLIDGVLRNAAGSESVKQMLILLLLDNEDFRRWFSERGSVELGLEATPAYQ